MRSSAKERFREALLCPSEWSKVADQLLMAADLIEPKVRHFHEQRHRWAEGAIEFPTELEAYVPVYFMLCSYAIENLLKSILIHKQRSEFQRQFESHNGLPRDLKNHDLYALAKKVGLPELVAEEEGLLKRLTQSAIWRGRYPVPLRLKCLEALVESKTYNFSISLSQMSSSDIDDIKRLVNEIRSYLAR